MVHFPLLAVLLVLILVIGSMCLKPIYIKNPTFNRSSHASEYGACVEVPRNLLPQTEYIEVPCGKCDDCRSTYYNSILQRSLVESRSSYMYFITLTYDNNNLPCLILPTGDCVYYFDYSDIQNLFKRLRACNVLDRDFRYLCVNEYGDRHARPHAHLLLFVARLTSDDKTTPYHIERLLFDNIKRLFAKNIGTRKNPNYVPLFTYCMRYTSTGVKTNYFVKYVEPTCDNADILNVADSDTYLKTIRYLIGYINKGSSFDTYVNNLLQSLSDLTLVKKLKSILRSRLRYSKGFGNGFSNGKKLDLLPISIKASSNTLIYSDLVSNLPKTYSLFAEEYENLHCDLNRFIQKNAYSKYKSISEFLSNLDFHTFYLHCIILFYFPNYFNVVYQRYYRSTLSNPSISYFFSSPIVYNKTRIYSSPFHSSNLTFDYLRKNVEDAITAGVPYLAFKVHDGYTALCPYYKKRITTLSDVQAMYDRLGVRNYSEWKELFLKQLDLRKTSMAKANRLTHENNDKIIWNNQKHYLNLPRLLQGEDLYRVLLSDCKQ